MTEAGILTAAARRLRRALTARPRPGHRVLVDGIAVGLVDDARRERLLGFTDVFQPAGNDTIALSARAPYAAERTAALDAVARTLAAEGALTAWRNERYAVRARVGDPPLFLLERAAAHYFGIATYAAHGNGVVQTATGPALWFARRSASKPIDPSQLDNLVGGGVAAGESPDDALVREAWEEAGIDAGVARARQRVGALHIERGGDDGWQRETVHLYDLPLPSGFVPANQDGEAVEHRLVDAREASRLIAHEEGSDMVTVDASLVVLDWLARNGAVATGSEADALLRALRVPSDAS